MTKIHIRYLVPGLIECNLPTTWDNMGEKERKKFCSSILNDKTDRELIFGLSELIHNDIDSMFDSTPPVEAIEMFDENTGIETVMASDVWTEYAYNETYIS